MNLDWTDPQVRDGEMAALATSTFGPLHLYEAANDNSPPIIALSGAAGSGKSTAADYLVRQYGYERVKFAGPLKDAMRALGLTDYHIEGDGKERPCALLQGKTPRYAMQTIGTQWGRDLIGPHFWVGLWEARANEVLDSGGRVVVDDCRFPNEADAVRKLGGVVVRLVGRGGIGGGHSSETMEWGADEVVHNVNDIASLRDKLDLLAAQRNTTEDGKAYRRAEGNGYGEDHFGEMLAAKRVAERVQINGRCG